MNGAGADDHDQTIIAVMEDVFDLIAIVIDKSSSRQGQGKDLFQIGRRDDRRYVTDIDIVGLNHYYYDFLPWAQA